MSAVCGWRVGSRYLLPECVTEVELSCGSARVQAPEGVGVDDTHIDEPPCERRPVLHRLPLHSIGLPELIDCVNTALANIVVEDHLRLGDDRRLRGSTVGLHGGHDVDLLMCAEHLYGLLVTPHQAAELTTLSCLRLTLTYLLDGVLQARGEVGAVGTEGTA